MPATEHGWDPVGDVCARCGQRPVRYWSYAVLGPVRLSVTPWCEPCHLADVAAATAGDAEPGAWDEDAEPTPEELEEGLLALGPVDWAVLRPCLPPPSREGEASPDALAFVADAVRRIAAHHGQPLPPDVRAFVERHAGPPPPAT